MTAPIWISHRGFCRHATENTRESFRAAIAEGFEHLETDLRTTADGHIVLSHDAQLERLCGVPLRVEQVNRKTLEQMVLRGGERLLFFDQFLEEFASYRWIFDIKPESAVRTVDALLQWWRQPQAAPFLSQQVRYLFWQANHQKILCRERPEVLCMARLWECRRAALACLSGTGFLAGVRSGVTYAVPPRFHTVNLMQPRIVQGYRERAGRVLAYLPDTATETREALRAGVDEILTNAAPIV